MTEAEKYGKVTTVQSNSPVVKITFEKVRQLNSKDLQPFTINDEELFSAIIKNCDLTFLPEKYKQKVINKEPFEIEIITTNHIRFSGENIKQYEK